MRQRPFIRKEFRAVHQRTVILDLASSQCSLFSAECTCDMTCSQRSKRRFPLRTSSPATGRCNRALWCFAKLPLVRLLQLCNRLLRRFGQTGYCHWSNRVLPLVKQGDATGHTGCCRALQRWVQRVGSHVQVARPGRPPQPRGVLSFCALFQLFLSILH